MKTTAPKQSTFWIAVALAVLAFLSENGTLSVLPIAAFWLLVIAFVLLALGVLVKNL